MDHCKKCALPIVRAGFCQAHWEWNSAYQRAWRAKTPGYHEREHVRKRTAYAENPERYRAIGRKYYRDHVDECIERSKRHYGKLKETVDSETLRKQHTEASRKYRQSDENRYRLAVGRFNKRTADKGRKGRIAFADFVLVRERQGGICFDCGQKPKRFTLGHAVPLFHEYSTGGPENLILQCSSCNSKQHNEIHPKFRDSYWARVKASI